MLICQWNVRLITKRQFDSLRFIACYFTVSLLFTVPTSAWALDAMEYDARLCSSGIVVLGADLRKQLQPATPDKQKLWLKERINGTLSTLIWLCRRYAELHHLDAMEMRSSIEQLKNKFAAKDWAAVQQKLSVISNLSPLRIEHLKPGNASEAARIDGGKIYSRYCMSCHLRSMPEATPPVFSLSDMARNLPEKEFIARMIVGVHGTQEIALQNPLSDRDISGMFAYLRGLSCAWGE